MQVLEHHEHRRLGCPCLDCFEEPLAGEKTDRRDRTRFEQGAAARLRAEQITRTKTKSIEHRGERPLDLELETATEADRQTRSRGRVHGRSAERGLARARFAGDEQHAAGTVAGSIELCTDSPELCAAADELRSSCHLRHWRECRSAAVVRSR